MRLALFGIVGVLLSVGTAACTAEIGAPPEPEKEPAAEVAPPAAPAGTVRAQDVYMHDPRGSNGRLSGP